MKMRDQYDRMHRLTWELASLVTATEIGDDDEKIGATSIELPAHVFDHVSAQMASTIAEWHQRTKYDPLKGEMRFHGILIKRGRTVTGR
jgi:hypothetical protein